MERLSPGQNGQWKIRKHIHQPQDLFVIKIHIEKVAIIGKTLKQDQCDDFTSSAAK